MFLTQILRQWLLQRLDYKCCPFLSLTLIFLPFSTTHSVKPMNEGCVQKEASPLASNSILTCKNETLLRHSSHQAPFSKKTKNQTNKTQNNNKTKKKLRQKTWQCLEEYVRHRLSRLLWTLVDTHGWSNAGKVFCEPFITSQTVRQSEGEVACIFTDCVWTRQSKT